MTTWRNWSGSVTATPEAVAQPRTEIELRRLIEGARKVRVVGAGHSFTPLCATDGLLLKLDALEGEIEVAPDRASLWAPAGWSLSRLTAALWSRGFSLLNQGDVNPQSLAGAIATGTHGTGRDLGNLSSFAEAFRMVLADGTSVVCSPDDQPELFEAQRLSLGLLGVVTHIKIKVAPAYYLEERITRRPLREVLETFHDLAEAHRHAEFFVFPYSDDVIVKTLHPAPAPQAQPRKRGVDIEDSALRLACEVGAAAPATIGLLQRTMMRLSGDSRRIGPAYEIFPSERETRFEEMEYELPRAAGLETLERAIRHIRERRLPVTFPFEFRVAAGDDIWLSPFNHGPSASISMHQFHKLPWREVFDEIEPMFQAAGGRPHWAKRHSLTAPDVARLYPRLDHFRRVRRTVDPTLKFANDPLIALFGLERA